MKLTEKIEILIKEFDRNGELSNDACTDGLNRCYEQAESYEYNLVKLKADKDEILQALEKINELCNPFSNDFGKLPTIRKIATDLLTKHKAV